MAWPGIDQWLGGAHEHELAPMSWEELGALADRGSRPFDAARAPRSTARVRRPW